ncbi:AraC family transcriptional regulator [Sphaerisporangium melleum]|uniref:AraC family transcriptional regulator n=1 Tax=Sphaerisporangium melleum TaxID=321316 RepID=A0A917RP21_9ACTN|nr:helix-turn-helix domain-containing protein [Sphaerisporangium melleum]GGL15836.1 AraC family transcriptional regulator [Sphaerisporangium melleum]GII69636.1 AraC family transcriptional regulator [Sphaerisporangium melleum]
MAVIGFRTSDLPVADRFTAWCEMANDALVPNAIRSDHAADFRAEARLQNLGMVQLTALSYPPLETYRPAKLIRRSDPEELQLMVAWTGSQRIVQSGRDTTVAPGELLLYDTSRPWQGWTAPATTMIQGVMVQFPRSVLPLPEKGIRDLMVRPLAGREGLGALLTGHLRRMAADTGVYTAADGPRLGSIIIDLVTTLCAHHLERDRAVPPETHRRTLQLKVRTYIEQHLGDPHLSPESISIACQISVRHLHRLFEGEELTLSAWIRQRRLERCRRDLGDPALLHRSIRALAAHWGITDSARFSRMFRAAYGVSPNEYRGQALHFRRPSLT